MDWGFLLSLSITILAVIGVFVDIPFVSDYAFWVLLASYIIFVGIAVEKRSKLTKKHTELTKKVDVLEKMLKEKK